MLHLLGLSDGTGVVVAAAIAAVPAALAAILSYRNGRRLKTSNGKQAGAYIEEIRNEQIKIATALVVENQLNEQSRQALRDHMDADARFQADVAAWMAGDTGTAAGSAAV